jgi:hypothetical protein
MAYKREPFKLKSGNISGGSSFKMMGATQVANPGESPTKLIRTGYKILKKIYRKVTGRTTKSGSSPKRDYDKEVSNLSVQTNKSGTLTKKSRENIKKLDTDIKTHNKSIMKKPVKIDAKDVIIDLMLTEGLTGIGKKTLQKYNIIPETQVGPGAPDIETQTENMFKTTDMEKKKKLDVDTSKSSIDVWQD